MSNNELLLTLIIYFGKSIGLTFCVVTFCALSGIHPLQTLENAEKHVVTHYQVLIPLPSVRTASPPKYKQNKEGMQGFPSPFAK